MRPPVSLEYVVVVALLALSAAALSFVLPNPAFSLAALLLGIYALHLVSVRIVVRQYTGAASGKKSGQAGAAVADVRRAREELELERRELENRKAELQERIAAAEQQWQLLRQMIRDRVEAGASLPGSMATGPQNAFTSTTVPGHAHDPDGPRRVHGRW